MNPIITCTICVGGLDIHILDYFRLIPIGFEPITEGQNNLQKLVFLLAEAFLFSSCFELIQIDSVSFQFDSGTLLILS